MTVRQVRRSSTPRLRFASQLAEMWSIAGGRDCNLKRSWDAGVPDLEEHAPLSATGRPD